MSDISTVDPLDTNIDDVDTSYPVIPARTYEMEVKSAEIVPSSKDASRQNLKVQFKTTEDVVSVSGETIKKGFVITNYISITPSEDYTVEAVKKAVTRLARAAGCTGTVKGLISNPAQFVGRIVKVDVGIQKATSEYSESNKVKGFVETK